MNKREELVQLSGQIINGMMSADSSLLTKIVYRTINNSIAVAAVDIALKMIKEIDKHY